MALWVKKSTDIREQLGIFNINDKLTQYEINWREHIQKNGWQQTTQTNFKLQRKKKKYRMTTNEMGR